MKGAFVMVCLMACLAFVNAGFPSSYTYPIRPATAAVDNFIPLNNDRVEVLGITADTFGAAVLDFGKLDVGTPIVLDLPGGITFDSDRVTFGGNNNKGPVSITTQLNDFNVNAADTASFQGTQTVDIGAYTSDIYMSAVNGNVEADAFDTAYISAPSVVLDGRYATDGIFIGAGRDIDLRAGTDTDGRIDLNGRNVHFSGDSEVTFVSNNQDISLSSGRDTYISGQDVNIVSHNGEVHFHSDVGSTLIEGDSASFTANTNFNINGENGVNLQSLRGFGSVRSTSGTVSLTSDDKVQFVSSYGGISVASTADDISFTAGQSVAVNIGDHLVGSATSISMDGYVTAALTSNGDLTVTGATLLVNSQGDLDMASANDITGTSQTGTSFTATGDVLINSGSAAQFTSTTDVSIRASNYLMNQDDSATLTGSSITGDVSGAFNADSGSDFTVTANKAVTFNSPSADFLAQDLLRVKSSSSFSVTSVHTAKVTSGDNLIVRGAGTVTVSDSTLQVQSGVATSMTANDVTVASTIGDISLSNTGDSYVEAGDDLTFNASGDLSVDTRSLSVSGTTASLVGTTSVSMSATERLRLSGGATTINAPGGTASWSSAKGFISNSGNVAWKAASVSTSSLSQTTTTRDSISVSTAGSVGQGDIKFTSNDETKFFAREGGSIASAADIALTNGDLTISANAGLQGEWSLHTTGEITLSGKGSASFTSTADSHEFSSTNNTLYRFGGSMAITVSDDGIRNYDTDGDHIDATFTSQGAMSFTVQKFTISSESVDTDDDDGSVYVSGDAGVSMTSTTSDFTINSRNDDVVFASEDNMVLSTGAVFTIDSTVHEVYFNVAEFGTITTGASMSYSGDSVLFDSDLLTNITVTESTLVQKANARVAADNHVTIAARTTFSLKTEVAAISYTANGGGIQYVSTGASTITAGSSLTANVDEDLSFYARSGAFSSSVTSGTMNYEGGDVVIKTNNNSSMLFDSTGGIQGNSGSDETIELSSGRNFLALYKDNHRISAADDITIKALGTQADVCITTTVDATGTYDAILFSGAGVSAWTNGTATFTGKSATVSSIDGSVGLVSYGSQLDPDNLLLPVGIELGVLIRSSANPGTILIESAASAQFYANDRFNSSAEGSISLVATGTVDIHSNNFLQNVTMMTADGLLTTDANLDLKFIAGSPNQAADLVANATGKISFSSSSMLVHQYGSNNANKKQGIAILGSLGNVHFSGKNGINVDTSNGDGNINVLARAGDVVLSSTSAATTITADRSKVFLEGNTGAFFTATQNSISFDARTDGGSILVNTQPGTADTSFSAGTNIALTSTGGKFSLDSVSGITLTTTTATITAPCINLVGGGSVEVRSSNIISYTGSNSILADAQVDMTVDAKNTFSVTASGVFNIDAGGDGVQSGFTLSSVGQFKAVASVQDIRLSASVIDFEAQQAYNVVSPQVELTATGSNAGSGDSIVLRAAKGNVIVSSDNGITMNSQAQTKLTTTDEVTMTVTGASSNFLVQAGNLAQIVSPAATYTITQDVNINARDIVMNTEQSWTATSSAGKIVTNAEGTLTTLAPKGITLTTVNGPTTISTVGLSSDLRFLATGSTSKITMATGGTGPISFLGDGLIEILPSSALTVTALNDVLLTAGNLLNVTSHDDLKATSVAGNLIVSSARDLLFQDGIRDVADMKFTYGTNYLAAGSNIFMHASKAITFKEDTLLQTATTSYKAEGIASYTQVATNTLTTTFAPLAPAQTGTVLFVARGHQQRLKDSIPIANNPATLTLSSDTAAVSLSTISGTLEVHSDSEIVSTVAGDWTVISAKSIIASATGARGIEIATQNDFRVGSITRPANFISTADHMTLDGETGITLTTLSTTAGDITFLAQTAYESQDPDIIVQSTQSTIDLTAADSINIFPNSVSSYNQERGRGQISFTTNGAAISLTTNTGQIVNKASNEIRYEGNTAVTATTTGNAGSIYLEAGGTVAFDTDAQLSFATGGANSISLSTQDPFSNIDLSAVYLEMLVPASGTGGFTFTSKQTNTNREALIDIHSAENVKFTSSGSTNFNVATTNFLVQSLGHQVVLSGTTLSTSNSGAGSLRFASTGNDGSVDILAGTTLTLTAGKEISMNSRRGNVILENIYSYSGVGGNQLTFDSANDVIFESLAGTNLWRFQASANILIESNGPEADIDILNGGSVTFQSNANVANSLNLVSLGNLGAYAAPFRESERDGTPNVDYTFYTPAVNIPGNFGPEKTVHPGYNTRGFEFSAINGGVVIQSARNMFLNSLHGSVEFRAQFNIAYRGVGGGLGGTTLSFFQQTPHPQVIYNPAYFAPADYCLLGTCTCGTPCAIGFIPTYCACSCSGSCAVLTNAIKAILNVLLGYGLIA